MNQSDAILKYLQAGHSLSPLEALHKFGCLRLGARIWDLKRQGHAIETQTGYDNGKHFAVYSMRSR